MKAESLASQHAHLVESALRGEGPALVSMSQEVRKSWQRCSVRYALDPATPRKPRIVDRDELKTRREALGSLLPIAHIEMVELCRQMLHSGFGVMLTDRDGVIVNYVGDPSFSDTARRSGFREGAIWNEEAQGTNGMGTCLVLRRPVLIHQHEHFLAQNTGLTCSAAPIFDPEGRLLAALDISGRASAAQTLTLAMVNIAALNIENRVLLNTCRQHYVLRFHRRPEFVSTSGEGLLAVDDQGVICGANRCALDLLGYPEHRALCGHAIDEILETSAAALIQLAELSAFHPEALRGRLNGNRLYFVAQSPERSNSKAATEQLAAAEKDAQQLGLLAFGDAAMAHNVRVANRVANRDISILLLGETGTGKGYFAKSLHSSSHRAEGPFVAVNCAAIPESLIESELFGYEPGAFTGATRSGHAGRIVQANHGTLFLDEIGDMPLPLQVRLLSVIEDHEVLPLGGSRPVSVDIRIVSATHRNLAAAVATGTFREDLYYRLNGITITLPPLRSRSDKMDLIRHMLQLEIGDSDRIEFDDALLSRLASYPWPGNLRQLRNVIRSMLALRESNRLTLSDLHDEWLTAIPASDEAPTSAEESTPEASRDEDDLLGSAEREALLRVLRATHWNVSAAAAKLHLSRKTMYRKMHRHGIQREAARFTVLSERRVADEALES